MGKSRILFTTWESLLTDENLKSLLHAHFMKDLFAQIVIVDAHRLIEFTVETASKVQDY